MDPCAAYMYCCPRCGLDTPHSIIDRRNDVLGVVCVQCRMPSIVRYEVFRGHQSRWEEELRKILSSLEQPNDDE